MNKDRENTVTVGDLLSGVDAMVGAVTAELRLLRSGKPVPSHLVADLAALRRLVNAFRRHLTLTQAIDKPVHRTVMVENLTRSDLAWLDLYNAWTTSPLGRAAAEAEAEDQAESEDKEADEHLREEAAGRVSGPAA